MVKKPTSTSAPPASPAVPWQRSESFYLVGRAHLDGVDALAIEMEHKWGAGRLRLLVNSDLRARFDMQRVKLNRAINSGDLEDVQREAARMCNAWNALDAAATAAGCEVLSPLIWEVALSDGRVVAIARTNVGVKYVLPDGRKVDVFTLDEIANLIEGFPELVKIKQTFPGAAVVRVKPIVPDPLDQMNDELPW